MNLDKPWININYNVERIYDIGEIIVSSDELSKQTSEHIKQAKEHLERSNDGRARKDAIRECLTAMDNFIKENYRFKIYKGS